MKRWVCPRCGRVRRLFKKPLPCGGLTGIWSHPGVAHPTAEYVRPQKLRNERARGAQGGTDG